MVSSSQHIGGSYVMDWRDGEARDFPAVDQEDVWQEIRIWSWMHGGRKPSRRVIEAKLAGEVRTATYGEVPEEGQSPWQHPPVPSAETISKIVEWALEQADPVQKAIWGFLEVPEERLEPTLDLLGALGLLKGQKQSKAPKGSLQALVFRSLPATLPELYELARQEMTTSKRPEAAVRQAIRTLVGKGKVYERDGRFFRN